MALQLKRWLFRRYFSKKTGRTSDAVWPEIRKVFNMEWTGIEDNKIILCVGEVQFPLVHLIASGIFFFFIFLYFSQTFCSMNFFMQRSWLEMGILCFESFIFNLLFRQLGKSKKYRKLLRCFFFAVRGALRNDKTTNQWYSEHNA